MEFYTSIKKYIGTASTEAQGKTTEGVLSGKKFVFTGFRNKIVEGIIKREGGTVANSVTKDTYVLFASSKTTVKATKAIEQNIKVIESHEAEIFIIKKVKKLRKKKGLPVESIGAKKARKSMVRKS